MLVAIQYAVVAVVLAKCAITTLELPHIAALRALQPTAKASPIMLKHFI
jgi:hypothetical protein